ncbi:vesicle transport through interaction with t-SNAREs homolog 1A [Bombyx mandarina]|uniref:Vesicle transport through interaction with t-SNAREs homolog 1A n=1 Tax=Bombyx mandarina TaxID=7092 RepID=A0A6J2KHK6_BOMMA|nr:vesicle transport through interaction with t-SNAREs homolog 1A [Bombyx mandarina]
MATLVQSYEQQYSVLTADITAKIGRLKNGTAENREQLSREIQSNFEEANDLLEQLELEARGPRVAAYRAELQRVKQQFKTTLGTNGHLVGEVSESEDWGAGDERRQLLDNSERLERGGRVLSEGYRVLLETEQVGAAVLQDLSVQRETIQRSRARLRETDEELGRSWRVAAGMSARALRHRALLLAALGALALLTGLALYLALS